MDEQRLDDQLEPIYSSSVPIQVIARKTNLERWTIETGGERGSERFLLTVRYDNDRNYIQKLWADKGCRLEDLPGAIGDRDE